MNNLFYIVLGVVVGVFITFLFNQQHIRLYHSDNLVTKKNSNSNNSNNQTVGDIVVKLANENN